MLNKMKSSAIIAIVVAKKSMIEVQDMIERSCRVEVEENELTAVQTIMEAKEKEYQEQERMLSESVGDTITPAPKNPDI